MSFSSFLIRPPGSHIDSAANTQAASVQRQSRNSGASFAEVMADKGISSKQEIAAVLPGSRTNGRSSGASVSAASMDMRRSHGDWNPAGIPLAGSRSGAQGRSAYGVRPNDNPGVALKMDDYIHTKSGNVKKTTGQAEDSSAAKRTGRDEIGMLSARFESGSEGIAAIGYDGMGGTSYGKYQIASRVGGMKDFLQFLDARAPDMAERLRKGGPADTGGRKGKMPDIWRSIAKEEPKRFEQLQEDFIHESHYKPALAAIVKRTRLDEKNLSPTMREVIWSTAVQHGPAGAARLFDKADDMSGKEKGPTYERKLISNVYSLRAGQFGSSSQDIQASVARRFVQEKMLALNMLDAGNSTRNLA